MQSPERLLFPEPLSDGKSMGSSGLGAVVMEVAGAHDLDLVCIFWSEEADAFCNSRPVKVECFRFQAVRRRWQCTITRFMGLLRRAPWKR